MHQLNFNSLTTACSTCWNSSNVGTPDVTATLCTADSSIMSQTEKIEPSH